MNLPSGACDAIAEPQSCSPAYTVADTERNAPASSTKPRTKPARPRGVIDRQRTAGTRPERAVRNTYGSGGRGEELERDAVGVTEAQARAVARVFDATVVDTEL